MRWDPSIALIEAVSFCTTYLSNYSTTKEAKDTADSRKKLLENAMVNGLEMKLKLKSYL